MSGQRLAHGAYWCPVCSATFITAATRDGHLVTTHGAEPFGDGDAA